MASTARGSRTLPGAAAGGAVAIGVAGVTGALARQTSAAPTPASSDAASAIQV